MRSTLLLLLAITAAACSRRGPPVAMIPAPETHAVEVGEWEDRRRSEDAANVEAAKQLRKERLWDEFRALVAAQGEPYEAARICVIDAFTALGYRVVDALIGREDTIYVAADWSEIRPSDVVAGAVLANDADWYNARGHLDVAAGDSLWRFEALGGEMVLAPADSLLMLGRTDASEVPLYTHYGRAVPLFHDWRRAVEVDRVFATVLTRHPSLRTRGVTVLDTIYIPLSAIGCVFEPLGRTAIILAPAAEARLDSLATRSRVLNWAEARLDEMARIPATPELVLPFPRGDSVELKVTWNVPRSLGFPADEARGWSSPEAVAFTRSVTMRVLGNRVSIREIDDPTRMLRNGGTETWTWMLSGSEKARENLRIVLDLEVRVLGEVRRRQAVGAGAVPVEVTDGFGDLAGEWFGAAWEAIRKHSVLLISTVVAVVFGWLVTITKDKLPALLDRLWAWLASGLRRLVGWLRTSA